MTIEYPRKVTITIEEQDTVFSNVFVTEDVPSDWVVALDEVKHQVRTKPTPAGAAAH